MDLKQDPQELLEKQINPLLTQDGLTCSIDTTIVTDRKSMLDTITSQRINMTKEEGTYSLKFVYNPHTAHLIMDFIITELECCGFFDFDLLFRKEKDILELRISSKILSPDKLDVLIDTMIKS